MCKETKQYQYLFETIEDDALKKRAETSLNYYIEKANFYKNLWGILSVCGIVLPALATYLAATSNSALVPIITAATTVCTGLLALFKCSEKKNSYRNSAENMKCELTAYLGAHDGYGDKTKADEHLWEQLEKIIQNGYNKISKLEKTE